jgi:hypothetical protein
VPKSRESNAAILACVLFAYVLSMGPVVRLVDKGFISRSVLVPFIPLFALAYEVPFFYRATNSYLQFWDPGFDLD